MNNAMNMRGPLPETPVPTGTLCLRLGHRTLLLERRAWLITLALIVALVLLCLLALTLGSGKITMMGVVQTLLGEGSRLDQVTVFKIRLPRIVAVLVAGAAMGLSGCLVQTLIRNRLATPDMIGVNEGASLAIIAFSLYLGRIYERKHAHAAANNALPTITVPAAPAPAAPATTTAAPVTAPVTAPVATPAATTPAPEAPKKP